MNTLVVEKVPRDVRVSRGQMQKKGHPLGGECNVNARDRSIVADADTNKEKWRHFDIQRCRRPVPNVTSAHIHIGRCQQRMDRSLNAWPFGAWTRRTHQLHITLFDGEGKRTRRINRRRAVIILLWFNVIETSFWRCLAWECNWALIWSSIMVGLPCSVRIAISIKIVVPILFLVEFGFSCCYVQVWLLFRAGRIQWMVCNIFFSNGGKGLKLCLPASYSSIAMKFESDWSTPVWDSWLVYFETFSAQLMFLSFIFQL